MLPNPRIKRTTKYRLLSTILLTLFFAATTYANEVPNLIHFEGYLTKTGKQKNNKGNSGKSSNGGGGQSIQDGEYDMVFSLYDVAADGDPLWTETWDNSTSQVLVSKGHYRVFLGTHTPLPPTFFKEHPATYLGITIGDDEQLLPRQKIASVPYAMSTYSDEPPFPAGGIIMWSGEIGNIPEGWALCDGTNGTPDLRERFVLGAGGNYGPGQKGGSNSHTHSLDSSLTVSGTTSESGSHKHLTSIGFDHDSFYGSVDHLDSFGSIVVNSKRIHEGTGDSENANARLGYTDSTGNHTHNFSGTVSSSGKTGAAGQVPPFFALAYIMKI